MYLMQTNVILLHDDAERAKAWSAASGKEKDTPLSRNYMSRSKNLSSTEIIRTSEEARLSFSLYMSPPFCSRSTAVRISIEAAV